MSPQIHSVLIISALVCFILAAVPVTARFNLGWLGCFLALLAFALGGLK